MHLPLTDRFFIVAALLLSVLPAGVLASEEGAVSAQVPGFVRENIYNPNSAQVDSVIDTRFAGIVLLDGGLEQGLQRGMVCSIDRGLRAVGEVIIIESRMDRSAGLILDLTPGLFIETGDIARIKTIQIN